MRQTKALVNTVFNTNVSSVETKQQGSSDLSLLRNNMYGAFYIYMANTFNANLAAARFAWNLLPPKPWTVCLTPFFVIVTGTITFGIIGSGTTGLLQKDQDCLEGTLKKFYIG